MIRTLILGVLGSALLLAGGPAQAEGSPDGEPLASPSAVAESLEEGRVVDPPLPTTSPETQGGALLGETVYAPSPYGSAVTAEQVQRAVRPSGYRGTTSPWQGQARLRWRYRHTTEADQTDDNDLYAYLKLKYRDETLPGWSASFHGRATLDVGPFGSGSEYYAFNSITDSYAKRLNGRLYHLYANYRFASGFLDEVRIGRQYADVGEYILFDGVRATTRPLGCGWWQFTAFAGLPSYLYDSTPDDGRFTAGGSVTGKPFRQTGVQLDYTFIRNENDFYGRVDDHLWNLNLTQRIGMNTLLRGTYQHLNEDPRLGRILFDTVIPSADVTIRGYWHSLLNFAQESVYDFDYYYAVQLALEPYWMGNLAVSKGIGEFFVVEGGFNIRQLYKDEDEGRYNRNFEQYYASVSSHDWLLRDLELSLAGEFWDSDDDIWTITFDIDYRPNNKWRFRFGTDYSAFRYDIFADDERENVYGAFLRASWYPKPCWQFDLRLRVDNDDYGTWTTLDAGVAFNF